MFNNNYKNLNAPHKSLEFFASINHQNELN